jgi:high affinity Mn2+ porin
MNWALWESGAWDSPGDVLGFTGAAAVEWHTPGASWRYAAMMEPREANSNSLDPHIGKALGQILECDLRYSLGGQSGAARPFLYCNRANMGLYSAADARSSPPDIAATRAYRSKEGLGLSWDQALAAGIGAFARLSWNDGRTEDITFSEIDRSAAAGLSLTGSLWGRREDVLGIAGVANGLSPSHRAYLAEGGTGFLLGDGKLNYGAEEILELYYRCQVAKWLQMGPDVQYIEHPGYNRDRGGFAVYAIRAHAEY